MHSCKTDCTLRILVVTISALKLFIASEKGIWPVKKPTAKVLKAFP